MNGKANECNLFPGSLILPPPGARSKMRDPGNEVGMNEGRKEGRWEEKNI